MKYPPAITLFQSFMIDYFKEAEILQNENTLSSRIKLGAQKGQSRLQDNVDLTAITDKSFDIDNCAYCKHRFVIPIGMDINDLTRFNNKVQKQHLDKMIVWNNIASKKRGPKPRPNKSVSQHLAYLCCKMNCLERRDGSGCMKCESACSHAIEQGSDVRSFFG